MVNGNLYYGNGQTRWPTGSIESLTTALAGPQAAQYSQQTANPLASQQSRFAQDPPAGQPTGQQQSANWNGIPQYQYRDQFPQQTQAPAAPAPYVPIQQPAPVPDAPSAPATPPLAPYVPQPYVPPTSQPSGGGATGNGIDRLSPQDKFAYAAAQQAANQPPAPAPTFTGDYQSSIAHGLLPQAEIDSALSRLTPPAAHTNWSGFQRGVSPEASAELNMQQDDQLRADSLANRTQLGRDSSQIQSQMQNQYDLARANDSLSGWGNLLGNYRNQLDFDLGNQALDTRKRGMLLQLLAGGIQ